MIINMTERTRQNIKGSSIGVLTELAKEEMREAKKQEDIKKKKEEEQKSKDSLSKPTPKSSTKKRERVKADNEKQESFKEAVSLIVAEVVYRSIPLSDAQKSSNRELIKQDVAQFLEECAKFADMEKQTRALATLRECAADIVENSEGEYDLVSTLTNKALTEETGLNLIVTKFASDIEERVLNAFEANKVRQEALNETLNQIGTSDNTEEYKLLLKERAEKKTKTTLLETLYVANAKAVEKAEMDVSDDIIMAEAVCHYTLLEVFSSIGIIDTNEIDLDMFCKRLMHA